MPSHRADTPADAPTTVRTRPTATAPQQRRRDLRTAEQNGGPDVAFPSRRQVHSFARSGQEAGRGGTALLERETPADHTVTWGAVALDPLFVTRPGQQLAEGWVVAEPVRGKRPRQPSPRRTVPPQARPGSAHPDAGDAPFDAVTAEEPAEPPPPVPLLDRVWRAPDIAPARADPCGPRQARPAGSGRRHAVGRRSAPGPRPSAGRHRRGTGAGDHRRPAHRRLRRRPTGQDRLRQRHRGRGRGGAPAAPAVPAGLPAARDSSR